MELEGVFQVHKEERNVREITALSTTFLSPNDRI